MSYLQAIRLIPRDAWKLMWVSVVVGFGYFGIYGVVFNLYVLRLGYGPEFVGVLNGTTFLASALCAVPAGMVGRRWGLRRGILGGYGLWLVASILLPLTQWIPPPFRTAWLLMAFPTAWIGAILFGVNRAPYLVALTSAQERTHAFSISLAINSTSAVVGSLVAGFLPGLLAGALGVSLEDPLPYILTLCLPPLLYLAIVPSLWSLRDIQASHQGQAYVASRAPSTLVAAMVLFSVLAVTAESAVKTFFNVYMDSSLHATTTTIGAILAAGQFLAIPAALATPLLATRWGKFRTILGGTLGLVAGALLLAYSPQVVAAGLGYIGMAMLVAILDPMRTIYHQEIIAAEWRSTMAGAAIMAVRVGSAGMVGAGGFLITGFGYPAMFTLAAILTFAGASFFGGFFRRPSAVPASAPSTG
ncbi:MAG TPA: MFS transporter [Anaerolineales bacterium]